MRTTRRARRAATRLWRLCLTNQALDERRVRDIAEQLIASEHSGARPVLSFFLRLVKLDRARHAARVESADVLDADVRVALEGAFTRRYGPTMTTTFVVDPTLIGGLRVTIGSDVYDGSVRGGLAALAARF